VKQKGLDQREAEGMVRLFTLPYQLFGERGL
jgi:hypothetical protein